MGKEELKVILQEKIVSLQSQFSKAQLVVICLLLVALTLGGAIFYLRSRPRKISVEKVKVTGSKRKRDSSYSRKLFVHVSGAVKEPGVYELNEGKRVIDAVRLAGGAIQEADLDALNLAAKVRDGQKIYVPRFGEAVQVQADAVYQGQSAPLNLNTATKDQLEELPGIGLTLAQRIIDWRTTHNGFSSVDQLKEVEGIGPKKFERLKDKVSID